MNNRILYIALWCYLFGASSVAVCAQPSDSLSHRIIMRCVQYGVGYSNIFDTYLSTEAYKGVEFRVSRESMRLVKNHPQLSLQNFFQADIAMTRNRADNNNTMAGMANWNYGLHRQFRITDHFKILAGAQSDMNLGFVYNLRNSNNPASLRAAVNIDASAMAIWHLDVGRHPLILRYQLNVPLVGVLFSPEMGESYYEIFSLGNHHHTIHFASLHNQPSLRQYLSLDIPLRNKQIRLSYYGDMQQTHVNGIKTHAYSHVFMLGFVKYLYRLRPQEIKRIPASLTAY